MNDDPETGAIIEEIRLDRFGRWWHQDERITHPRIVSLFHRSIQRTAQGNHYLVIGPYSYPIRVEDTPYFVVGIGIDEANGQVKLTLSDESEEALDPEGVTFDLAERLAARIKEGRFEARFLRAPYHAILNYLVETPSGYAIRIGPTTWPLEITGA